MAVKPVVTPQISVIVPVFNEGASIAPLAREVSAALVRNKPFELIFVDDGSSDDSPHEVQRVAALIPAIRLLRHDRNRGQSAAVRTGVLAARANVVAVLDGDGQNDPADLPALCARLAAKDQPAMVIGERRNRQDAWLRRLSSRVANTIRARLLGDGIADTGCGIKVFRRDAYLALPAFDHMHRFLPALLQRDGGTVLALPVNHRPRLHGVSKYGVGNRLWVGMVDLLGVRWLQRRQL